jgi:protein involved in polysaccharide export with SLBB domain
MCKGLISRAICLLLVLSLVAPTLGVAQAASPAALAQPPAPSRALPAAPGTRVLAQPGVVPAWNVAGPEYRLGNGDVLEVQIAGRLEVTRLQVIVGPDGVVSLPPLGAIEVGGLTLLMANQRISERARALLRFAEVSLVVTAPRVFDVTVSGEVERPGTLPAQATQRLHELILGAGGVTARGSLRRVRVTQGDAVGEIDLLRFELAGDVEQNPYVQDGMRVHVPPRGAAVTLAGAVRRPGEYELGPRGSLRELLELVGGLSPGSAAWEARLTRLGSDGRKQTVSLDLRTALAAPGDVELQDADTLFVPAPAQLQDVVEVRGAFLGTAASGKASTSGKPTVVQRLELAQGERVRDVIERAGGVAAHADLTLAFVDRAGAGGPRQRIPLDLQRLLVAKDTSPNILLQTGDVLTLPVAEDKVYVVGEVKVPGAHDFRPDLTPREYLALAGGPGNRAKVPAATVTFRNGRTYAMAEAPPLEPGAVVTVPEVAIKWWQDYVQIAQLIASLVTAYTGLFILFTDR